MKTDPGSSSHSGMAWSSKSKRNDTNPQQEASGWVLNSKDTVAENGSALMNMNCPTKCVGQYHGIPGA